MEDIRKNYTFLLDNLIDDCNGTKEWTFVKMIDFAHAFEAEDDSIDKNYLFGIENLVRIFEQFLKECTNWIVRRVRFPHFFYCVFTH